MGISRRTENTRIIITDILEPLKLTGDINVASANRIVALYMDEERMRPIAESFSFFRIVMRNITPSGIEPAIPAMMNPQKKRFPPRSV